MKTRQFVVLTSVVLLALALSAHVPAQFVSIPIVGETTGKAIEGNPQMVITASYETRDGVKDIEYDTIPTIPEGAGLRLEVTLLNLAVRPEADSTLGVVVGTAGSLSFDEWRGRTAAEKSYSEKTRGELRRAYLGSIDHPGRWITAVRTSAVDYTKQKKGQNGPLMFTAYIEPTDLKPGINTLIVRVHGIMEQRTTQFLILGRDGKSIFGTVDEPWLVKVEEDNARDFPSQTAGNLAPATGDYITTQELRLVLDDLEKFKEEIRAMLGGGRSNTDWRAPETNSDQPPAPAFVPTPQIPDAIGISFSARENSTVSRQEQVKVSFDRDLPAGSWVEVATFSQGQWWPWQKVSGATTGLAINLAKLQPGPIALTVAVRNTEGKTLGFAQLTLTLEDN